MMRSVLRRACGVLLATTMLTPAFAAALLGRAQPAEDAVSVFKRRFDGVSLADGAMEVFEQDLDRRAAAE